MIFVLLGYKNRKQSEQERKMTGLQKNKEDTGSLTNVRKLVLKFAAMVLFAIPAAADPRYEADVNVDVTAATVTEAKKQAMAKAVRDGLNEVVLSISTAQSADEINKLNDNQLQHFVSGIMVLMEKSSDVRYIADLRISVNEDILKAYLAENNMPLVAGEEQDVLAVPLLEKEDGTLDLWSDENIWRQAFQQRRDIRKGNLVIRDIEKNLGNITAVEANRIYDMTDGEYNELADFNNVTGIYVLKYSLKDGKVYVRSFPGRKVSVADVAGLEPAAAIDKVLPFFKDVKKAVGETLPETFAEEKIEAVYSYPKLGQWMALKRLLEGYPQVKEVKVVSMANGKVHFNFLYSGVIEKLQANLGLSGYKLRKEGGYYAIY